MNLFLKFNQTTRPWHLPFVAGLAVGVPLILGWHINNIAAGKLASLAGLSILYLQSNKLAERMMLLMICCFGIMISFAVGLFFSFNPVIAPIVLALFSFVVHYSLYKFNLSKPPGNFFFIMLASIAISSPFQPDHIAEKIGYVAIGTFLTCGIGFIYSLLTLKNDSELPKNLPSKKSFTNSLESVIFGLFIGGSLALASIFKIENPYWVPISCLAIMQASSSKHVWTRGFQRILGTLIGLGIAWLIAYMNPTPLFILIGIIVLQIIIEYFVVRNYGVAMIFVTVMIIFLGESGWQLTATTDKVFITRLIDILIGSGLGIIGGWILYHEKVRFYTIVQMNKAKKTMYKLKTNLKY